MIKVVGVRFKSQKIYHFDPVDIEISQDEKVIVETARGMEYGIAVVPGKEVEESDIIALLSLLLGLPMKRTSKET